jgi:hypothetical protein
MRAGPSGLCTADERLPRYQAKRERRRSKAMDTFTFGDFLAHAAHTVSGYLRRRPDPACENALRTAFAELDAELAAILGNRDAAHLLR